MEIVPDSGFSERHAWVRELIALRRLERQNRTYNWSVDKAQKGLANLVLKTGGIRTPIDNVGLLGLACLVPLRIDVC
jgi:hypothetical protein